MHLFLLFETINRHFKYKNKLESIPQTWRLLRSHTQALLYTIFLLFFYIYFKWWWKIQFSSLKSAITPFSQLTNANFNPTRLLIGKIWRFSSNLIVADNASTGCVHGKSLKDRLIEMKFLPIKNATCNAHIQTVRDLGEEFPCFWWWGIAFL